MAHNIQENITWCYKKLMFLFLKSHGDYMEGNKKHRARGVCVCVCVCARGRGEQVRIEKTAERATL